MGDEEGAGVGAFDGMPVKVGRADVGTAVGKIASCAGESGRDGCRVGGMTGVTGEGSGVGAVVGWALVGLRVGTGVGGSVNIFAS